MSDDTQVPVVCPECDTRTEVSVDTLAETIERHNDARHDGEECAQVDPDIAEQLQDLVAEDMGLLE